MKIYDIMLFLVILHLSAAVVNGLGVWSVPGDLPPENMSEYDPEHMVYPAADFSVVGLSISVFSVGAVVGFMVLGLGVSLFARVPTHQLIAIVVFAAFFGVLTGSTATIMAGFFVPDILIEMFVVLNGIVLLVGVLQLATGVSLEHTA